MASSGFGSPPSAQRSRKPRKSLEDILSTFEQIEPVSYTLFQTEPYRPAEALLPLTFPRTYTQLITLISSLPLISSSDYYEHQLYTNIQRIKMADKSIRDWSDLFLKELNVFARVIIYTGVYQEPQIRMF